MCSYVCPFVSVCVSCVCVCAHCLFVQWEIFFTVFKGPLVNDAWCLRDYVVSLSAPSPLGAAGVRGDGSDGGPRPQRLSPGLPAHHHCPPITTRLILCRPLVRTKHLRRWVVHFRRFRPILNPPKSALARKNTAFVKWPGYLAPVQNEIRTENGYVS